MSRPADIAVSTPAGWIVFTRIRWDPSSLASERVIPTTNDRRTRTVTHDPDHVGHIIACIDRRVSSETVCFGQATRADVVSHDRTRTREAQKLDRITAETTGTDHNDGPTGSQERSYGLDGVIGGRPYRGPDQ